MAITNGQGTVPTGGTVLCHLPAGPGSVTISNAGPSPVYVGVSTAATIASTSGMPIPSGGFFTFPLFAGSSGYSLCAVTPGTASVVGFLISNAQGGLTQPGVN